MYLTAQRVQVPSSGRESAVQGINAFFYIHGAHAWQGPPPEQFLPENDPGVFTDSHIEVPPPGNRVRSYLDIVAPDGTSLAHIDAAIAAVPTTDSLPITWFKGDIWCRFSAESALSSQWRRELQRLRARAALLYQAQ